MIKSKRLVNLFFTLAVSWGFIATDFWACQKAQAGLFDDLVEPITGRCGIPGEGTIYVKSLLRRSERVYVEVDKGGKLSGVKGHELNAQNTGFSTGICNRDGFTVRVYTPIECGKTLLAESRFSRVYNEETVWIKEDGIQLEVGDVLNYFTEAGRTALSLIATYYSGGKMAPVALEEASKFEPCLTDSPGCPAAPDLAQKIRSDRCLSAAVNLAKPNIVRGNSQSDSSCENLFSSGRSLVAPHTDQRGKTWGGEITINSALNGQFNDGLNLDNINRAVAK
jgi:hypothetical protein